MREFLSLGYTLGERSEIMTKGLITATDFSSSCENICKFANDGISDDLERVDILGRSK